MDAAFAKNPFDNVMSFFNSIPQSHEKALKHALYNAIGLLLFCICGAAGWGVLHVLGPFVKPLTWALLAGSVLHPFKHSIAMKFEDWTNQIGESANVATILLLTIPVRLIDEFSEIVGSSIVERWKLLVSIAGTAILSFLVYSYIPSVCIQIIAVLCDYNYQILLFLMDVISAKVFLTLLTAYGIILTFYWSEEYSQLFSVFSYCIWFVMSLFAAGLFGILRVPLLLLVLVLLAFGFAYELTISPKSTTENVSSWRSLIQMFPVKLFSKAEDSNNGEQVEKTVTDSGDHSEVGSSTKSDKPARDNWKNGTAIQDSWKYIYGVIWACTIMMIWKHIWMAQLLQIPIGIYIIKKLGLYFGVWELIRLRWRELIESVRDWVHARENALLPAPIRGLRKLGAKLSVNVLNSIKGSINSFASCLVIFGLIFFAFSFTIFMALQIYAECIHMISVGAEIINSTVVHNPEFLQLLPDGWGEKMDSALNNAYIYGREGISKQVQHLLKDVEKSKAAEFERHLLEFWDRIYQAWLMGALEPSQMGPKVTANAVFSSWGNFVEMLSKTPDLLNVQAMTDFARENVGTLMSLLESIWAILKGNMNLIFQFLFATLSVLLGGGTAVLNFAVSVIVFLTALFYLLNSSGSLYKPVDLLSNFSPISGNRLGVAFEAAVNGVFTASFKMALFYGLWTWFIHNLFQVRIVYLPSVLAAIFGVVPLLGTYWAAIPAVLDLWLAQHKGILAIVLFVAQCLPISFVDAAIYSEIKGGGHPYMTALAIAGGVFCMGIEGAILGPVLLCCLLVALNMSSTLMRDSPTTELSSMTKIRQLRRLDTIL